MKLLVCLVCVFSLISSSFAQTSSLRIATDKTTTLVFPFAIKHVDRGTKDVLVESVKEANNILLVKAAVSNFSETNLSVVTEGGTVYSFIINYGSPQSFIYHVPTQSEASISTYASGILDNPRTMRGIKQHKWDMVAKVVGIYIREKVIYYQLSLENKGPIDYDIEFLRFYIRDKKKNKRTATQEIELTPLCLAGNAKQIKASSTCVLVVALDKFTLPDAKYLAIEAGEKNGGRNLLMRVNNKKIIMASILPDLK